MGWGYTGVLQRVGHYTVQREVARDGGWQARLRGEGKEGWNMEKFRWQGSVEAPMAGQGLRLWPGSPQASRIELRV